MSEPTNYLSNTYDELDKFIDNRTEEFSNKMNGLYNIEFDRYVSNIIVPNINKVATILGVKPDIMITSFGSYLSSEVTNSTSNFCDDIKKNCNIIVDDYMGTIKLCKTEEEIDNSKKEIIDKIESYFMKLEENTTNTLLDDVIHGITVRWCKEYKSKMFNASEELDDIMTDISYIYD